MCDLNLLELLCHQRQQQWSLWFTNTWSCKPQQTRTLWSSNCNSATILVQAGGHNITSMQTCKLPFMQAGDFGSTAAGYVHCQCKLQHHHNTSCIPAELGTHWHSFYTPLNTSPNNYASNCCEAFRGQSGAWRVSARARPYQNRSVV